MATDPASAVHVQAEACTDGTADITLWCPVCGTPIVSFVHDALLEHLNDQASDHMASHA